MGVPSPGRLLVVVLVLPLLLWPDMDIAVVPTGTRDGCKGWDRRWLGLEATAAMPTPALPPSGGANNESATDGMDGGAGMAEPIARLGPSSAAGSCGVAWTSGAPASSDAVVWSVAMSGGRNGIICAHNQSDRE